MKPSVLIIADFPNWAYYEIQQFIKNNLSDEFEVYCDFFFFNTLKKSKNPLKRIQFLKEKQKYQIIRKDNTYDIVVYLGFYFDEQMKISWKAKKVVKGIYTGGFPPQNASFSGSLLEFKKRFLVDADAVVCGSEIIKEFYKTTIEKVYYANLVIDKTLFKRQTKKIKNTSDKFNIGWTGNPNREFKGLYSHIIPAVELAQKKYPNIRLKTRFSGPIKTLSLFYEDIDVIVIASDADAGPSLFGEASLMDIPSISTNIGWPHEIIKNNENGFIVEKDIEEISKKIIELYENRELLHRMSKRIREDYLVVFNTKNFVKKWKQMFNELLEEV